MATLPCFTVETECGTSTRSTGTKPSHLIIWNAFEVIIVEIPFDPSLEEYKGNRNQPIPTDTILTLDARGNVQMSWGANTFFMPHTITVDAQNNVWVTDVALHQVFKFLPYGGGAEKKPVIILGEKVSQGFKVVDQDSQWILQKHFTSQLHPVQAR